MSYTTLVLPFNVDDVAARWLLSTSWLFKVATHRMLSLAKQFPVLPATDIGWKNTFRKTVYGVVPNRRYTDGVIVLVRDIYESCRQLGVDFREVELGDWLMFQQSEKEFPVRNITLRQNYEFWITTINYNGESKRMTIKPTIPKNCRPLLDRILEEKQKYTARVVIKDYGIRKNKLWIHGEIQVTIPIDFYYKHTARYRGNNGRLYGGVDVNTDRINLAIVDRYCRLRDVKTFWFEDATRRGYPRRKARILVGMAVHKMLRYAYHHGVRMLFLEDPSVVSRLRLLWIRNGRRLHRNYNWRVSVFRSSVMEMITMKAPLYAVKVDYVDPKGTTNSEGHNEIMKRYGVDRHTASAYLIAMKGIKRHAMIQKATT